jgi:hypothetical protein
MVTLYPVPSTQIDFAWKDGASQLLEAVNEECTSEQLKMLLSRGERQLVRMDRDGNTVGWGVFRVDNFPNLRSMHITNLVARRARFEEFYDALKAMAKSLGCSQIRCCATDAPAKIYAKKLGFVPVYTTLKAEV